MDRKVESGTAEDVEVQTITGTQHVVLGNATFRGCRTPLPNGEKVRREALGALLPPFDGLDLLILLLVLGFLADYLFKCWRICSCRRRWPGG